MKNSRQIGAEFELRVRKLLTSEGYVVCKWHNQVDLETGEVIPAKNFFHGKFAKMIGSGFPDFIAFLPNENVVIGIEVKLNRILKPIEKEKVKWYKDKGVFSDFYIAYEGDDGKIWFHDAWADKT